MVAIIGILLAFISIILNDEIFEYSPRPPGPLVSSYLFLVALFLLLCELEVYPASLRKLGTLPQIIIEMFISAFIAEIIVVDFWFPLEASAMDALDKTADGCEELVSSGNWNCDVLCDVFRNRMARYIVSYILSIFFLITVLHASRFIDLRALDEGVNCFFNDIVFRVKRNIRRHMKNSTNSKYVDMTEAPEDKLIEHMVIETCSGDLSSKDKSNRNSTQKRKRRKSSRLRKRIQDGYNNEKGDFSDYKFGKRICSLDCLK